MTVEEGSGDDDAGWTSKIIEAVTEVEGAALVAINVSGATVSFDAVVLDELMADVVADSDKVDGGVISREVSSDCV